MWHQDITIHRSQKCGGEHLPTFSLLVLSTLTYFYVVQFNIFKRKIIYLKGGVKERRMEREGGEREKVIDRERENIFFYLQMIAIFWGWNRLQPGSWDSTHVSRASAFELSSSGFSGALESWIKNRQIWCSNIRCWNRKQWLNSLCCDAYTHIF